ncbi:MAG: CHASE3 domain-containing protein, partial [Janthinobacterium lividum]
MAQYLVARANALLTCLLVVVLCLVGGATWERLDAARAARAWSQHSYEVLGTLQELSIAVRDAETGQRGFLLTGGDEYLAPYQAALGRVGFLQGELQRLTADNPGVQDELRTLSPLVARKLEELAQTVELRRDVGLEAAMALVRTGSGRLLMARIEGALSGIAVREHALLDTRLAESDSRARWVRWLLAAGTALSVALLLWAARLLNQAWRRSSEAEARQRVLALQLRTSLDSLSQGVAVFGPDHGLRHWNDCFGALLGLPRALVRQATPYAALAEHTGAAQADADHAGTDQARAGGVGVLETEDQVRHGRGQPGRPVVFERARADGRQLEVRRTAMPDGGFVLTVTDMTRRAQAEAV